LQQNVKGISTVMDPKSQAYEYLLDLQTKLNSSLPGPAAMIERIPQILDEWEAQPKAPMKFAENAFLYDCALPLIFEHMAAQTGIGADEARQSVLCEYYACVPQFASANGFRRFGYPFKKQVGATTSQVIEMWRRPDRSPPANQAFPDLAFRKPFPHKIVFDAKYFSGTGARAAEKALVDGVYEAAFYRGLPFTPAGQPGSADWDYEYGCLLAYDASDKGYLKAAWNSV
jgi:hypothetical protein